MLQGRNLGLLFQSLRRKRKQREMSAEMNKATFWIYTFCHPCLISFPFYLVYKRFVRIWMFPASELRVASDGPATLFGFGGAIFLERMCFSVRSPRNCLAMPSDCGTETMTGILSWEATHRKYRIILQALIADRNEASAACVVSNALIVAMNLTINSAWVFEMKAITVLAKNGGMAMMWQVMVTSSGQKYNHQQC